MTERKDGNEALLEEVHVELSEVVLGLRCLVNHLKAVHYNVPGWKPPASGTTRKISRDFELKIDFSAIKKIQQYL